jgi:hypothetical protein
MANMGCTYSPASWPPAKNGEVLSSSLAKGIGLFLIFGLWNFQIFQNFLESLDFSTLAFQGL